MLFVTFFIVMLSVHVLGVILLSVIMLSVVTPKNQLSKLQHNDITFFSDSKPQSSIIKGENIFYYIVYSIKARPFQINGNYFFNFNCTSFSVKAKYSKE
jgi:hypothetical protein